MFKFAKDIHSKHAKAITKKRNICVFFKFSPGNQLITLYQLFNFGAPSCNGFCDIKFSGEICKGQ